MGLETVDSEESGLRVHVLDTWVTGRAGMRAMKTGEWRWVQTPADETPEWLESTAKAAEVAARRAERAVANAKADAFTDGMPAGMTAALAEAEAHLAVCEWRVRAVRSEQENLGKPPCARTLVGGCVMDYRLFMLGGFTRDRALSDLMCLDLEQPDERERRLADEFSMRLERETFERAIADAMQQVISTTHPLLISTRFMHSLAYLLMRSHIFVHSLIFSLAILSFSLSVCPQLNRNTPRCVRLFWTRKGPS